MANHVTSNGQTGLPKTEKVLGTHLVTSTQRDLEAIARMGAKRTEVLTIAYDQMIATSNDDIREHMAASAGFFDAEFTDDLSEPWVSLPSSPA